MAKRDNPLASRNSVPVQPVTPPPADSTAKDEFNAKVAGARYEGTAQVMKSEQFVRSQYAVAARYQGVADKIASVRAADEARPTWAKWLDNVFPDDMGGMPGPVGLGARSLGAGYTAFTENASQGASWGLSALPGGIKTLDWDMAGQISPGRVRVAMGVERRPGQDAYYTYKKEQAEKAADWQRRFKAGELSALMDKDGANALAPGEEPIVVPDDWDVTNPEDEAWLFGNSERLNGGQMIDATSPQDEQANLESGLTDALFTWYLDPLVIGGKAIKIGRFGSEMLGTTGLTHRATTAKVVESIGFEADDAIRAWETGGSAGAKNQIYTWAENIANRPGHQLVNEEWAQGPFKDNLVGIADMISDVPTAVTFLAASTGNAKYIAKLQKEAASVHDAVASLGKANPYEYTALNRPIGMATPAILDDVVESNRWGALILEDLITRDEALKATVDLLEKNYSPIQSVTGRYIPTSLTKAAQARRAGKADREFAGMVDVAARPADDAIDVIDLGADVAAKQRIGAPLATGPLLAANQAYVTGKVVRAIDQYTPNRVPNALVDNTPPAFGSRPGVYEQVFQRSKNFRKVKLWNWIEGQRSSGWLAIRDNVDGNSADEWNAALTDSRALRNEQAFILDARTRWNAATSATERMILKDQIESDAVARIALTYGVPEGLARSVYLAVAKKRTDFIESYTKRDPKRRAYGIDPEDGSVIYLSPLLRSQLDTHIPMMDFRLMDKTIKRLAKPEFRGIHGQLEEFLLATTGKHINDPQIASKVTATSERVIWAAEGINSAWKAAVLMRLGYTQRNVVEGWLRTWAVLGTVPALRPSAIAEGAYRVAWANPRSARKAGRIAKQQTAVSKGIAVDRALLSEVQDDLARFANAPQFHNNPGMMQYYNDLLDMRDEITTRVDEALALMDDLTAKRGKYGKKNIGWDEAYAGEYGSLRRLQASNQQTQQNFLSSRAARDADQMRLSSTQYDALAPDAPQYFDELAQAGVQLRADPLGRRALAGEDEATMRLFFTTDEGRQYAREMGLDSPAQLDARVAKIHGMTNAYLPTPEARALVARTAAEKANGAELRSLLGGRKDLATIHGREVDDVIHNWNPYRTFINTVFKWLGTIPESSLVRQPFYNDVWKSEGAFLYQKARAQGLDVTDADVLRKIEATAHRRALKATNDTLFTLVRYSNPASTLRFLSPFFAAWENSMRTWTRIIVKDPSVAVRASILWNLPNKLGMVVDSEGNRVQAGPLDFLTGAQDQYVVLPQIMQQHFQKISGGVPFKVPKGSFNVVSPGESPFLPGFGPMVTTPAGMILASKPDKQEFLRQFLGESLYNQMVPFGNASSDVMDTLAPAALRKAYTAWRGEDSQDYIATMDAVTVDALVEWQLRGGNPDQMPTGAEIKARTDDFYKFSTLASLTAPVAITRMSAYQPMLDYWRQLNANTNMPYRDKVAKFNAKWGTDAYLPLINSTSKSEIQGLDPTMNMFNAMREFAPQVESLATLGESAPSILAATVADGPFAGAVYNWYTITKQPGTSENYKRKMMPAEIMQANQLRSMWTDYITERDKMREGLAVLGVSRPDSKAAQEAGITAKWDAFQDGLARQYGDTWDRFGPKSQSFSSDQAEALTAVNRLLRDEKFMESDLGQSPVWESLKEYMTQRKAAQDAYRKGGADKDTIKDLWAEWSAAHRWSSLKFADVWDQYLADDDLSVELG